MVSEAFLATNQAKRLCNGDSQVKLVSLLLDGSDYNTAFLARQPKSGSVYLPAKRYSPESPATRPAIMSSWTPGT